MIACTSRGLSVYHFQQYQHMDGLLYSTRIAFKIFFFLFCHRLDIFHRWAWKFLESQMHITDIDSKISKISRSYPCKFPCNAGICIRFTNFKDFNYCKSPMNNYIDGFAFQRGGKTKRQAVCRLSLASRALYCFSSARVGGSCTHCRTACSVAQY